ncbi:coiled-coil domain-containing protein 121 [Camelus ferus]|uniref:Coiled-coil domain-containing protein 121 n=2 Tax=Camelus TaxID=9836 RepID=S9WMG7_CAMFR|nr:coiled-coil domain-containing protein 121 [Camelus bactrianus]XP_014418969.1 coiled-coil domain-containing protein 121 [Camelus ferus]EPY77413.1 coiled-coil domain containing 121-like protein [Camelus ferus]
MSVTTRMGAQLGTASRKWRHWLSDCRGPPNEPLIVVGQGLLRKTPGWLDERGPWGPQSTNGKRVRFPVCLQGAGNRVAGEATPRARPAAKDVKQLTAGRSSTWAGYNPWSRWAARRPVELSREKLGKRVTWGSYFCFSPAFGSRACSRAVSPKPSYRDLWEERLAAELIKLAEDSSNPLQPDVSFVYNFLNQEKLTKAEKRFKEKAMVEMMKLDKQIKEFQVRLEPLVEQTRQLLTEKAHVQEENQFFLEYMTKHTEEAKQRAEKLWNYCLQQSREIEQTRQKLASKYVEKNSALKTEFLQKANILSNLNQQLHRMRDVFIIKEKQEKEIQTLQEEIKKTPAETAAKKEAMLVQFLQEKASLAAQLSELDARRVGKRPTNGIQALEKAAKQYTLDFHSSVNRQNQRLQKEIPQLIQKYRKLEATQSHIKKKKQQLQQEQWYLECLSRGRQRLQERRNLCPNGQGTPKDHTEPCPRHQIKDASRVIPKITLTRSGLEQGFLGAT